jgi:site-specific recombinase XerD
MQVRVSKSDAGLRRVPFSDKLATEIRSWLDHLERQGQRRSGLPFLVTNRGTAMKTQFAWRIIRRTAERADVRGGKVSTHTLRRTFGSDLLNRGMRLETASKLLGHAHTGVTQDAYAELLTRRSSRSSGVPSPKASGPAECGLQKSSRGPVGDSGSRST